MCTYPIHNYTDIDKEVMQKYIVRIMHWTYDNNFVSQAAIEKCYEFTTYSYINH